MRQVFFISAFFVVCALYLSCAGYLGHPFLENGSEQENSHATEDELASCVCLSRWTSCRSSDARRFRSVPRSFSGFLLGSGNIFFVYLFAQVGVSPGLLFLQK